MTFFKDVLADQKSHDLSKNMFLKQLNSHLLFVLMLFHWIILSIGKRKFQNTTGQERSDEML